METVAGKTRLASALPRDLPDPAQPGGAVTGPQVAVQVEGDDDRALDVLDRGLVRHPQASIVG